jgi:hypothetical protein
VVIRRFVSRPGVCGLRMMTAVDWPPVPYIAGEIYQRTESPIWGSPTTLSLACSSIMQTCGGAQTIVGSPAPWKKITRPSGQSAGALVSPCHRLLTWTASSAVSVGGTSVFGRCSTWNAGRDKLRLHINGLRGKHRGHAQREYSILSKHVFPKCRLRLSVRGHGARKSA